MSNISTPSAAEWFYMRGGERVGPVSTEDLCSLIRKGALNLATMVWNGAFGDWVAAGTIGGLRAASAEGGFGDEMPEGTTGAGGGVVLEYRGEGNEVDGPVGIGGWLIWPALGIVVSPVLQTLVGLGMWAVADRLSGTAGATDKATTLRFMAGMMGLLSLFEVYAAVLLFGKKRSAPGVMIGVYVGSIVLVLMMGGLTASWGPGATQAIVAKAGPGVIASVLWICYFKNSKRVRNTFVN